MIPEIIYALFCIFWAYANYRAIEFANERILHGINGLLHFSMCIYFGVAIHWLIGLAMVFEGRLFFDVALNLFRKRGIGYVPEDPKSIFDQAEKKVFGKDGITPKIIYLGLFVALNIIYFKVVV